MRGLKKAPLLAATRLPMDGKDIPGDAEKTIIGLQGGC